MKNNFTFLHFLFHSQTSGLIIILLLLFNAIATAQETPAEEFVLDGSMSYKSLSVDSIYNSYIECGLNTMTQRATDNSKSLLAPFNVNAINMQDSTQWIYYYSSSYYSKWEAEENQEDTNKVGVKHKAGQVAFWQDTVLCWSTKDIIHPVNKLVFGPTYHQEKWYRRWLYMSPQRLFDLKYTPRFRMALAKHLSVPGTQDVCRLYVLVKYRRKVDGHYINGDADSTYVLKDTLYLKVSDFPANGQFKDFYFSDFAEERWYEYPEMFRNDITYDKMLPLLDEYYREDRDGGQGVQFCIDWLRSDTLCTLYIDNIEVYDNNGWDQYIDFPQQVVGKITTYAQNFSDWTNIKHWMGGHEPASIDCYTPIKTVDAILQTNGFPPLMNTVWAEWTVKLNGESQLERYYNTVQPNKLLVELAPIQAAYTVVRPFDLEVLRRVLQESHRVTQDSGFYFHIQSYGEKRGNVWSVWRQPTIPEYKAMLMLALAHGADGLVQAQYNSEPESQGHPEMVGLIGLPETNYEKSALWYELRDNSIPRLKGTLGKKLLTLNYTGDTLYLGRYLYDLCCGFTNSDPTMTNRYLTLTEYTVETPPAPIHFHAGFFSRSQHPLDNYFMLNNLITTMNRTVQVTIDPPYIEDYPNYRFRNVEGLFDTTMHSDNFTMQIDYEAGEGYLYQVAPVIKYGGNLIYNETISSTTTLHDEMVIQNGAILTVNSTYNVYADITVKAGGRIVTAGNGLIKFYQGHKLIIEGNAILNGTVSYKLKLDFTNPSNSNGIVIKPGGSLAISYCEVKNAVKGITSELNLYNLNIQNVDFIDCDSVAVYIIGRNRLLDELTLTPPPPQIKYCNITNSDFGILASNLSQLVIQGNNITGTDYGIFLANISTPAVINNILTGSREMPGIFLESCNGIVRGNSINGFSNGLTLGHSSPDIGGNTIEHNWNRGIYVGVGSIPNLRGKLVKAPICCVWYAVSGYNLINENGGWEPDDDGSEMYINNANAILGDIKSYGCNEITDQRIPNTEDTPPLYNTQLLMNCESWTPLQLEVHAEGNFWDEHPIYRLEERFGDCIVYLDPILSAPCLIPDGSGGKLFITSSTGEIIDTLYAEQSTIGTLTETEELYATAEEKFLTAYFENAEIIYNQIIIGNDSLALKLDAYRRLFEIGKFLGRDEEYFTGLRNTYLSLAGSTNDTMMTKIFNQLSSLSLVANQEYVPAINEFDEIIQQNPNTEEAVFAEIDALTTALMVGDGDSTLQKGTLGKYLIKSSSDYNSKLDGILRKHFGNGEKETEDEIIPTEYTLYQNYPNPFNPTTTIKYDLPTASEVSLIIYDILGRKVKELVNTKQQAGRYEVQFNASNLASGVYIYQLIAEKFISSRKMILLK